MFFNSNEADTVVQDDAVNDDDEGNDIWNMTTIQSNTCIYRLHG